MHPILAASIASLALSTAPAGPGSSAAVRVDIDPDNGRSDLLTPGWESWRVAGPAPSWSRGGVTVTLAGPGPLRTPFFKPNLVYGATMATDGVASEDWLELTIRGLSPGRHTLATYHNQLDDAPPGRLRASVDGVVQISDLVPSTKIRDDTATPCAFLEFDATDRPVVVRFESDGSGRGRDVTLSGFEVDNPDPRRRAIKPAPADDDEHADADSGSLGLSWVAPASAASHDVYFGASREEVARADQKSPAFRGNRAAIGHVVERPDPQGDYYWRVDEVDAAGVRTRGDVWHFRTRHLAFPGAEGYGRFARGGRGGRVIEVTNLDDSGPGSFRAAVDAQGPRTVVFRVSGVVNLKSAISIRNPYVTVAGQTAPGDGICFKGYPVGTGSGTRDMILRYCRIRVGDEARRALDGAGIGGDHTILDHCSIGWSIDEGLDTRTAKNATFQRCIISEALDDSFQRHPHAYAASISGEIASYHHNLLAHCTGRVWSLAGGYDNAVRFAGRFDIRNNVVYNWAHRSTDGGAKAVNFVNNYYKPGPATRVFHLMKPDVGSPGDRQVYYIAGNRMVGHPEYDADNWAGVTPNGQAPLAEFKSDTPLFPDFVTTTSADEAYRDVLADVGATLPRQDAIDRRIIAEVRDGKTTFSGSKGHLPGIIDTPGDLGPNPWPDYRTYDVPADSDHDGLPDDWERAHGSNPHSPPGDFADSNADPDGDGYTALEDYLNRPATRP